MSVKDSTRRSRTDWARVDSLSESEIDYSDDPATTEAELARAELRIPGQPPRVILELEPDVMDWFRSRGEGAQQQVNEVLRQFIEAHPSRPV